LFKCQLLPFRLWSLESGRECFGRPVRSVSYVSLAQASNSH
jgi:hypothetical protein